ncbi:TniB family NTP-binding protein [Paenirhodobacter populi]|nr:TniB family NTP-binding protein [Sinirhodobacter populi]
MMSNTVPAAARPDVQDIDLALARLRARFFAHRHYRDLQESFTTLLNRRRADLKLGSQNEARGIAIIGDSGSGKTMAVRRLLATYPDLQTVRPGIQRADAVSLSLPSPASVKFVGLACLNVLGYPLRRDRTTAIIWALVHSNLRLRQTLVLHFDEAQDFYINQNAREMQSMINTLKALMQNPDWPVSIVLSGMPQLRNLINMDPQLARRFTPVQFTKFDPALDITPIVKMVTGYAEAAGLEVGPNLKDKSFVRRLIYAGDGEFGLTVELLRFAVESALRTGRSAIDLSCFVQGFALRSGCAPDFNPFLREDSTTINPRLLLLGRTTEEDHPAPISKGRRK